MPPHGLRYYIVPHTFELENGGLWRRLFHFCGAMGTIPTAISFLLPSVRLDLKQSQLPDTAITVYGTGLLENGEMGLKGWGVWTGSCCMTNQHCERWSLSRPNVVHMQI